MISVALKAAPLKVRFVSANIGSGNAVSIDNVVVRDCPIGEYRPGGPDVLVERLNCTFEDDVCGMQLNISTDRLKTYAWRRALAGSSNTPAVDRFGRSNSTLLESKMFPYTVYLL